MSQHDDQRHVQYSRADAATDRALQSALGAATVIWVLLRLVFIIVAWVAIYIAVFLGFMTLPLIMLGVFLLLYAGFDLGRGWDRLTGAAKRRR